MATSSVTLSAYSVRGRVPRVDSIRKKCYLNTSMQPGFATRCAQPRAPIAFDWIMCHYEVESTVPSPKFRAVTRFHDRAIAVGAIAGAVAFHICSVSAVIHHRLPISRQTHLPAKQTALADIADRLATTSTHPRTMTSAVVARVEFQR